MMIARVGKWFNLNLVDIVIEQIHKQLVKNAATIFRPSIYLLPDFVQKKILLDVFNIMFKAALEDGDFEFLEHKWLRIEVKDLGFMQLISYENEKLIVADDSTLGVPDVSFCGNLNDLVLIAGRKEDPDTLFFQRRLSIEGDTELGLEVKNLMDSIDLDSLPPLVNNMIHRLANFVYEGVQGNDVADEVDHAYSS